MRASLALQLPYFRGFAAQQPPAAFFALDRVTPGPCVGLLPRHPAGHGEAEKGKEPGHIRHRGHKGPRGKRRVNPEPLQQNRDTGARKARHYEVNHHRGRNHIAKRG